MRVYIYKVILLPMLILFASATAQAQDDVEYRMEIGGALGLASYLSDFNSSILSNMKPLGAVTFRNTMNPRMALRLQAMYTKFKGDAKVKDLDYPDLKETGFSFNSSIVDFSVTYEYNFFPYGTGHEYRGAQRLVPFVSLGLGVTYAHNANGIRDFTHKAGEPGSKSVVTPSLPLGFGMKYRIGDRTNLSVDWQMHFSTSDRLDGLENPYRVKSDGLFKNTDSFSTLTVALTYSFAPKCSTCMKDR